MEVPDRDHPCHYIALQTENFITYRWGGFKAMQSFDQPPGDENKKEPVEDAGRTVETEPSSPLYEFPAATPAPSTPPGVAQAASETGGVTGEEEVQQPSEEEVRRGLVYPPPPSYYQNMQVPPDRPPLPQAQVANGPTPYPHNTYAPQPQAYPAGMQSWQAPAFPPPQFPTQPPVKRSRKWLWIIVSICVIVFLVACGLCSWAFYNIFNTTFQQVSGATNIAQDYYKDIQNQDYADAYRYLQVSNLTQADFTQQAQRSDTQYGVVQSFIMEQPSFATNPNSGPNLSQWRITVDVTRGKSSYPVLLTVQQFGNTWKITYFDKV